MAETVDFRYRAFLSYAHADTAWAKWLHGRLEGFRVDKDLAGRATPLGPMPKTLRPIFLDRDEFTGGHTLGEATIAALDASVALIVLCSPVAATRPAVNEEVRLFRWRHPDRPVIPVIIDGTAPDNFPVALRYEIAADGTVTDRPVTILGPDLRETGDGRARGLAKVVAGLTGVGSDDIYRRAERARQRSARFRNAVIAVLAMLTVAAAGSAVVALQQAKTKEALLDATLERFTSLVNRAVHGAQAYSLPLKFTLGILEEAEGMLDAMAKFGAETPQLRYRKAVMLRAFADNYRDLGRTEDWQRRIEEAQRIIALLVRDDPLNSTFAYEKALMHERAGDLLAAKGDMAAAIRESNARHDVISRLAEAAPENATWQRELAVSHNLIGNGYIGQGNMAAAVESYRAGFAIAERLAKAAPDDAIRQRDLSLSYGKIAGALMMLDNLSGALDSFRAALAIDERLATAEPGHLSTQNSLSFTHVQIGYVLHRSGDVAQALQHYRSSNAILDRLAKADPANASWQQDLATSHFTIGEALDNLGNPPAALESFRAAHAIFDRLAKSDPGNAQKQHYLSMSLTQVGSSLVKQDSLSAALESFRASRAVLERLARSDPENSLLKFTLSAVNNKIGDVIRSQSNPGLALESYRDALTILERLVQANPGTAAWQQALLETHNKIGHGLKEQGSTAAALESYRASLAIATRLGEANPGNVGWQRAIGISQINIGDTLADEGNLPDALESYRAALAIREGLAGTNPANAEWQSELSAVHVSIGDALVAQGNPASALESYQLSLAIADRLASVEPDNVHRQFHVVRSLWGICVQGLQGEGRAACYRGFEFMQRVVRLDPDRADYKRLLSSFDELVPRLKIGEAAEGARYAEALHLQEQLAAKVEADEIRAAGKPGETTAGELNNLARRAVFAGAPAKAMAAAERSLTLRPGNLAVEASRAHALMYLGRADEARALYLAHKDKPISDSDNTPWRQVIVEDFADLSEAGLAHPLMPEIEAALGVAERICHRCASPKSP